MVKKDCVKRGKVGFMSPSPAAKKNPTYREVCTGTTSYVEVYDLEFDGSEDSYRSLCKFFFMFHDPTTFNRQGNDRGTQYASAIFYYDDKQKEIANEVLDEVQKFVNEGKVRYQEGKVTTDIHPATTFYAAQDDHQEYLNKNPFGYCNHAFRFKTWPSK